MQLVLALFVGGCGEATSGNPTGQGGGPGGDEEFFIEATVDGQLLRAETGAAAYFWQGLSAGTLMLSAESDERIWGLYVRNAEGRLVCGTASITLSEKSPQTSFLSGLDGATCEVIVTRAAPAVGDIIEGTFAGQLDALVGQLPSLQVTDGAFKVRRRADGAPP